MRMLNMITTSLRPFRKKGREKTPVKTFFAVLAIFAICMASSSVWAGQQLQPTRIKTGSPEQLRAYIESILGGKIVGVLEYPGSQSAEELPKVILKVERKGKETNEVIESVFDKEGRLIVIRNLSAPMGGKMAGALHVVAGDAVKCRYVCWKKCFDIMCYTYCWWICVMM